METLRPDTHAFLSFLESTNVVWRGGSLATAFDALRVGLSVYLCRFATKTARTWRIGQSMDRGLTLCGVCTGGNRINFVFFCFAETVASRTIRTKLMLILVRTGCKKKPKACKKSTPRTATL